VSLAKSNIFRGLSLAQKDFLEFVLFKYIDSGVGELDQAKLPELIQLKYSSISDATETLGGVDEIRNLFIGFQKHLYDQPRMGW
jgi:type I restriction enzyme R subunit